MSQCVVRVFENVTYAMIEYIFELPLNNYAISTLICFKLHMILNDDSYILLMHII